MIKIKNCQQMTNSLKQIHELKNNLQSAIDARKIQDCLAFKVELKKLISETMPVFIIEGKKFPITLLTTCGKKGMKLAAELKNKGINTDEYSEDLLYNSEFVSIPAGKTIAIVNLIVNDLFFDDQDHTYDEILDRAAKSGLRELPHEAGPDLLLKEKIKLRMGEWITVAMESINGLGYKSYVFNLGHNGNGDWLCCEYLRPNFKCNTHSEFLFRLDLSAARGVGQANSEA